MSSRLTGPDGTGARARATWRATRGPRSRRSMPAVRACRGGRAQPRRGGGGMAGGDPSGGVSGLVLAAPAANVEALYAMDRWLAAPVAGELAAGALLGGLGRGARGAPVRRRIARAGRLDEAYLRTAAAGDAGQRLAGVRRGAAYARARLPELEPASRRSSRPRRSSPASRTGRPAPRTPRLSRQIPGARLAISPIAGHLVPQRDPGGWRRRSSWRWTA